MEYPSSKKEAGGDKANSEDKTLVKKNYNSFEECFAFSSIFQKQTHKVPILVGGGVIVQRSVKSSLDMGTG